MNKFYDTCSLLELQEKAFENFFYISNITIDELENIKTSFNKDEDIKYKARNILRLLYDNINKYDIIIFNDSFLELDPLDNYTVTNDLKIISCALYLKNFDNKDIVFSTSDLNCYTIAKTTTLSIELTKLEDDDNYTGFKTVYYTDEQLAQFYTYNLTENKNTEELLPNQYLIICNSQNWIVDKYKWTGQEYKKVNFIKAESKMFGKVTPINGDHYQQLALDSLASNQITMIRGHAGTGKTYLAFSYMFSLLESGKIDKIIVFCNTVATAGSAKLGFYPGSRTEKLLDSQIGNLLESKLGSRFEVEKMIENGQLILLPMSDIRGYDTTGMNAAIYISEAQNLDKELMKLALQRIGEDSICIIDGDDTTQVDMERYAGSRNGMKRVSKVFRGQDFYGEVNLLNIYRSKIAKIADTI